MYGRVAGDVRTGFGDVVVKGAVGGDVRTGLGDAYVNAPVVGNVEVGQGDLTLGPDARVLGHASVENGRIRTDGDPAVAGGLMSGDAGHQEARVPGGAAVLGPAAGRLFAAAAFAACAALAAAVAPALLLSAARRAEEEPGRSLLFGLAVALAGPLLALALAVSIVGIPLLLLLAPAYLALAFFGSLVAANAMGRRAALASGLYRAGNPSAAAFGAAALAVVAGFVPLVGGLVLYCMALLGTGATVLAIYPRADRPRSGPDRGPDGSRTGGGNAG